MGFTSFGLSSPILKAISESGYTAPTPIQSQAIPVILEGTDLVGLAQTGTGKTAAYLLPLIEKLQAQKATGVQALIIVPTRELAEQINDVIRALAKNCRLRSVTIYGGTSMNRQIETLRRGVEIVVACPGRLLDHMQSRTINLSKVKYFVLDEADQMFDMGFLPNIRKIVRSIPEQRQTLLFSATMPKEVRKLADELLSSPQEIRIGNSQPAATISHSCIAVDQDKKATILMSLLKQAGSGSVLVFTRTKHQAKRLGKNVSQAGFSATSLQGNLSQNKRQEALDGFKAGKYQILVATDVAARGIDVSNIVQVINFDVPSTPEAYTHRIGRTGRAACQGEALTFVGREDLGALKQIEKALGQSIGVKSIEGFEASFALTDKPIPTARPSRQQRRPRDPNGGGARNGSGRRSPRGRSAWGGQSNGSRRGGNSWQSAGESSGR